MKVIHFEIPADNPERAVNFYKKVFNWKIDKWEGPVDYWLVTAGEGVDGGLHDLGPLVDSLRFHAAGGFENGDSAVLDELALQAVGEHLNR